MSFTHFLFASSLFAGGLAIPFSGNITHSLFPREANENMPVIGPGWDDVAIQQIKDGISDALEIASYVRVTPDDVVAPIFAKWFNPADRDLVNAVFDTILGGDALEPPGNVLLKDITIDVDTPNPDNDGKYTCEKGDTLGSMRGTQTENPSIVLCDPGALGHGGISKGYNFDGSECAPTDDCDVDAIICDRLDPRVSWKMETLGATLLHEYTHFKKMIAQPNGPLSEETDDPVVGVYESFNLDKSQATLNADSYVGFANQLLWTVICTPTTFGDPELDDADDPNCDDSACSDGTRMDMGE